MSRSLQYLPCMFVLLVTIVFGALIGIGKREYTLIVLAVLPVLLLLGYLLYRRIRLSESLNNSLQEKIRESRSQAEALAKSEERFRTLLNSVWDGIVAFDGKGRILFSNMGAERMFQVKHSDGGETTMFDFLGDEVIKEQFVTVLQGLSVESRVSECVTGRRRNGELFPMECSVSLLERGYEQTFVGVFRDISVRVSALKQLRLLDKAVETISQGILLTGPAEEDFPILYANQAFMRMTGYDKSELIGRNPRFLQGKRTDPAQLERIRKALANAEPVTMELINYRKSGEMFFNQLSIAPIRDSKGKAAHFVGVMNDVTRMNELREQFLQAQKMEAIGKLAGGVAHDFNNLLTVINGYAQLGMGQTEVQSVFYQYFHGIQEAGERASSLTRQLLAISKRQSMQIRLFDLSALLEGMRFMLQRLLGEQCELNFELDRGPLAIEGDSGQLEQVVLNLTINARDAMPEGGKLLWKIFGLPKEQPSRDGVSIPASLPEGDYVCLICRDNGIGMDAATRQRIFEPFFSTKSTLTHDGLGLSTTFGIIQNSHGMIQVDSELGSGTEFRIFLPWIRNAKFENSDTTQSFANSNFAGLRVLLVEDNADVRGITKLFLEGAEIEVVPVENGLLALDVLKSGLEGPFDLLITDILMPGMGGRELADAYLDIYPAGKVIFISGFTDEAFSRNWEFKGNAAFLMKPFEKNQLFQCIQNLQGNYQMEVR